MAHKEWVIRIVQFAEDSIHARQRDLRSLWLEQLRRAGIIKIHIDQEQVPDPAQPGEYLYKSLFDLYAPRHIAKDTTQAWAEQNASRMQSFGINAVAAPKWETTIGTPPEPVRRA